MNDLSSKTTDELLQELERRKKLKPIKPAPLVHPEFDLLRKEVNDYLNYIYESEEYSDDGANDYATAIFEQAVSAFYGEGIWQGFIVPMQKWQAKQLKGESD